MNGKQSWGRKETIVWPPHAPIYTFCALVLSVVVTLVFVWQYLNFTESPLRRTYTTAYVRSLVGATFKQHGKYRLLYVGGGKAAPRLALPADFVPGETKLQNGSFSPIELSEEARHQGYTIFYRGAKRDYNDKALSRWLRTVFFGGHNLLEIYGVSLAQGLFVLLGTVFFGARADVKRFRELKYGRRLKGPVMTTPSKFNKALKADGLAITTAEKRFAFLKTALRIPKSAEAKHIQIMGDTGTGKSTLIRNLLQQVAERKELAIVYDPAGEFTESFFNAERGDWILNPLDARTPYWTPSSELRNPAEARTIAASMYQPRDDKRGEFFTDTPQKIFAHLLKYKPSPEELVAWMSDESEIDRRLKDTELANFAPKDAPQQRSGVLASLGLVADSLRLLPTRAEAAGREWCATDWAEERKGWIFLTSTEAQQEALRPLHSLWIDLLVLRLLKKPEPGQKKVWLVIDELASLQRLPQFHTALTKGRKSNNPIVFGYQGKAQLETIYGHLAEVMLSQPTTKFILRTAEPNAAKWAAELIGEVEIERVRETVADGKRQGKSFTLDRQIEPLVMKSEVEGLPDLHAFVKINNYVSRFSFPAMSLPKIAEALMPRPIPDHKMWFNPLAPVTSAPAPSTEAETPRTEAKPRSKKAKMPATDAKPNAGAPLKEAEAIAPKPEPEVPQVVVPAAQTQSPSLSQNL